MTTLTNDPNPRQQKKDFRAWRQRQRERFGQASDEGSDTDVEQGGDPKARRQRLKQQFENDRLGRDEVGEPRYKSEGVRANKLLADLTKAQAPEPDGDEHVQKVRKHNARRGRKNKANVEKSAALLREMSARKTKK